MPYNKRLNKEREVVEMTEKKARGKHIGYTAQREQCRLNKYTYIEKINGAGILFCNYPFDTATHKKGLCKASTCTDMREIPSDILAADETPKPMTLVIEDDKVEVPGEVTEGIKPVGDELQTEETHVDKTGMPNPKNE